MHLLFPDPQRLTRIQLVGKLGFRQVEGNMAFAREWAPGEGNQVGGSSPS
jgi:hypothetical protein